MRETVEDITQDLAFELEPVFVFNEVKQARELAEHYKERYSDAFTSICTMELMGDDTHWYGCSECKGELSIWMKFCPHCGAEVRR